MKISRYFLVAACLGVTTVVSADAPRGQYAPFDSMNLVITDNFTGLTWQRTPGGPKQWVNAQGDCTAAGMRLPTLKELLTIVDESPHKEIVNGLQVQKSIDQSAFPNTPVGAPYWTLTPATRAASLTTEAFAVDFRDGTTTKGNSKVGDAGQATFLFRCVK